MSAPIDVLAVLDREIEEARMRVPFMPPGGTESTEHQKAYDESGSVLVNLREARAAVAELIEAADAALGVLGAYAEQIEGEWGVCLTLDQMLANGEEPEYAALRDSLARVRGAA